MSKEYNDYLREHISAVNKASLWMADNLSAVDELTDDEQDAFLHNVNCHDQSKYEENEYGPYDDYFYGEPDEEAFNYAWIHHIHANPHHWQHWILMNDDGKYRDPSKVFPLEMPKVYALEMVADWWSFSWRSGNLMGMFDWYDEHREHIILHQRTREFVESVLGEIRDLVGDSDDR